MLANDRNVRTGRALASSFLTMSLGVSVICDDAALIGCFCCRFTVDSSMGDGAEAGSDNAVVFSGSEELAIVREMISNAENFVGGGCLGVVDSTDSASCFLAGLFGRVSIGLLCAWAFGADGFCFARLVAGEESTCIRLSESSKSLVRAAGLGDVLCERCVQFQSVSIVSCEICITLLFCSALMLASINSRSVIFEVSGAGGAKLARGRGFRLILGRLDDDPERNESFEDDVEEDPMWNR